MSLTDKQLLSLAVLNNAHWCHTVCRAHAVPGQFTPQFWQAVSPVPPYYPNLITLQASCRLEIIQPVLQQLSGPASLKDSFDQLALDSVGFTKLFEAQWLLAPTPVQTQRPYQVVKDVTQLRAWETAWGNAPAQGLFNAALLAQGDVWFIAIYEQEHFVAGGIINRSSGVVGVSNVFCHTGELAPHWSTCLAAAHELGAGVPIVGYASRDKLALAPTIKFAELGPLSVWFKSQV